ncbi:MAG: patatin-like phospholipase family protein [Burkholderiaceae bacterium]|nr:patatin-like phospholipase family protein [Microbacteriaceae bacterium]
MAQPSPTPDFTLVLGGGGVAGIAWQIGLISGLADLGLDLTRARAVLGTSAGSAVGAKITAGVPIAEVYAGQLEGVPYEISKGFVGSDLLKFLLASALPGTAEAASKRVARLALAKRVGSVGERRAVIEARLGRHDWTAADLRIVTVDATTGEPRIVTSYDGVSLVDAVSASCAVPLIWPPVEIEGRRYIDGGVRSPLNLDLAPGDGPVIALAPTVVAFRRSSRVPAQRKRLGQRQVEVVTFSGEAKQAQGKNSLDKSVVPAVARAGWAQAQAELARLQTLLQRA